MGYSPWGRKESDTTERLCFHFFGKLLGVLSKGCTRGKPWEVKDDDITLGVISGVHICCESAGCYSGRVLDDMRGWRQFTPTPPPLTGLLAKTLNAEAAIAWSSLAKLWIIPYCKMLRKGLS